MKFNIPLHFSKWAANLEEGYNVSAISSELYAQNKYLNSLSEKEREIYFKGWEDANKHYADYIGELVAFRNNAINSKEIIRNYYDKKFAEQNKTS